MKKLIKTLTVLMVFMMSVNTSFAFSSGKMEKLLKQSNLSDMTTISISIRKTGGNDIVFEKNQNKLLHPASTLKIFSAYSALDVLGNSYYFKTQFFKDTSNNLYIKLGADPLLTSSQLKKAIQEIKDKGYSTFKNLYIDDSIIDKKEFAAGWMWDDDINSYTPKVSSYNLDGNTIKINLSKTSDDLYTASVKSAYPISVISNIKAGGKTEYLDINRYNWQNPDVVEISGNINSPKTVEIPVSSMRRYFIYNLDKALENSRINITGTSYASKLLPSNAELITEILNPITPVVPDILQNSNNLMAETIYKVAASKKYTATGTDETAGIMFKEFYDKLGVKTDDIIIKDGCGVSRNNLLNANWITLALNKLFKLNDFEQFKENMAQPGDGTLSNRLLNLRGEVWLKTGSLSNISAIAGYVKSLDGHTYSVAILIQNFTCPQTDVKKLEDEIIKIIYNR